MPMKSADRGNNFPIYKVSRNKGNNPCRFSGTAGGILNIPLRKCTPAFHDTPAGILLSIEYVAVVCGGRPFKDQPRLGFIFQRIVLP